MVVHGHGSLVKSPVKALITVAVKVVLPFLLEVGTLLLEPFRSVPGWTSVLLSVPLLVPFFYNWLTIGFVVLLLVSWAVSVIIETAIIWRLEIPSLADILPLGALIGSSPVIVLINII